MNGLPVSSDSANRRAALIWGAGPQAKSSPWRLDNELVDAQQRREPGSGYAFSACRQVLLLAHGNRAGALRNALCNESAVVLREPLPPSRHEVLYVSGIAYHAPYHPPCCPPYAS